MAHPNPNPNPNQVPAGDDWACNGIDLQRNGGPADGVNGTFSGHWFAQEIDRVLLNRSSAAPVFLFVALQAMHTPLPDTEVLPRRRVRVRVRVRGRVRVG